MLSKNSKGQLDLCRVLTLQIKMMRKKRKKLKKSYNYYVNKKNIIKIFNMYF